MKKSTQEKQFVFSLTIIATLLAGIFLCNSASAQNVDRVPIGHVSVSGTTEKEKSQFQNISANEEHQMVSKIMLLDSEIRAAIENQNLGTEILNQYFQKLNSVCVECISENAMDERATFVFTIKNPLAAQNILDFLEEYHTNL
jgi:hypothetical protein